MYFWVLPMRVSLFDLSFMAQLIVYGHVEPVSKPTHTFFLADEHVVSKRLTSTLCQ